MPLPAHIPVGARLMVRTLDGISQTTGRQEFHDYIGHTLDWDGTTLHLMRDAAANGSRPAQPVDIDVHDIVVIKPIPERKPRRMPPHTPDVSGLTPPEPTSER